MNYFIVVQDVDCCKQLLDHRSKILLAQVVGVLERVQDVAYFRVLVDAEDRVVLLNNLMELKQVRMVLCRQLTFERRLYQLFKLVALTIKLLQHQILIRPHFERLEHSFLACHEMRAQNWLPQRLFTLHHSLPPPPTLMPILLLDHIEFREGFLLDDIWDMSCFCFFFLPH
jgi:hypothetical protein